MTASSDSPDVAAAPPPARPASRGGALDLLRFSAALLIVVYHFGNESPRKLYHFSPIFERGYLATDFFLILSGYVLGRAYGPAILRADMGWGRFWLRRALRVWPAHAIVMIAFAAYVLASTRWMGLDPNPSRFGWTAFWQQLFLVHAWAPLPPALPPADGWNLPNWSLSALLVCYAAFPWLWRALGRVRPAPVLVLIGLAALVAADSSTRMVLDHPLYDLFFQFGLIRAAPLFLLGACLAQVVALGWPSIPVARGLLWGGLVLVALLQALGRFDFLSLMAIAAMVLGAGRLPVTRAIPALEAAAKLSFALFITHTFVGLVYWDQIHGMIYRRPVDIHLQWRLWWLGFPLAIAFAWAFDRWIDSPIQAALKPWLRGN